MAGFLPTILVCAVILTISGYTEGEPECKAHGVPLCMPYYFHTRSRIPNLLGQRTFEEVDLALDRLSYLTQGASSHELHYFLCVLYVPPCTYDFPMPPCRRLCEAARSVCEPLVKTNVWPEILKKCERYPVNRLCAPTWKEVRAILHEPPLNPEEVAFALNLTKYTRGYIQRNTETIVLSGEQTGQVGSHAEHGQNETEQVANFTVIGLRV